MISTVVVAGTLISSDLANYRIITFRDNDVFHPENGPIISSIPLQYWTRDQKNVLTEIENGKRILVKGHLESNELVGVYVLVEYLEFL